jgi:hypothetical protein
LKKQIACKNKKKTFACLKMKEEIQAKVYEKTKDMTFPELRAYLDKSLEKNSLWQKLVNRDNSLKQNSVFTNTSS